MTDLKSQLTAIAERAEAATPGPWFHNATSLGPANCVWNTDGDDTTLPHELEKQICGRGEFESRYPPPEQIDANMQFIAASRSDVPRLARALLRVVEAIDTPSQCLDERFRLVDSTVLLAIITEELAK